MQVCFLLGHRFYYGNFYTKICAICMPICMENGFGFLHRDCVDVIPLFYSDSVSISPQWDDQIGTYICKQAFSPLYPCILVSKCKVD